MHKFSFASVNMRRRNAAMHVLLNDNEEEDVLFVQEPWFNPVETAHCDTMYQGKDVLGGAANPKWQLAYPSFTNGQWAKVMTYSRIHDRTHIFRKNHCQMIVCVTDLQGPPSERMQTEKLQDLKKLAQHYARDRGSCDDTRISYLEFVESEAEADLTLARIVTLR
jgi:hypothetical protein